MGGSVGGIHPLVERAAKTESFRPMTVHNRSDQTMFSHAKVILACNDHMVMKDDIQC